MIYNKQAFFLFLLLFLTSCYRNHPKPATTLQPQVSAIIGYADNLIHSTPDDSAAIYQLTKTDSFYFTRTTIDDRWLYSFYRYDNNKINLIFTDTLEYDDLRWEVFSFNSDTIHAIALSTWPNMNGNTFKRIYSYDEINRKFVFAGSLSDVLHFNKRTGEIYEVYTGSWYMTPSQAVYKWNDGKLLAIKRIEHDVNENPELNNDTIRYYDYTISPKEPVWIKPYTEQAKNFCDSVWDNFFMSGDIF
jgi:hypothetical protein